MSLLLTQLGGGGADVEAALVGSASSGSAGLLVSSTATPLLGQGSLSATGLLARGGDTALLGQSSSSETGLTAPTMALAVVGLVSTGEAGTILVAQSVPVLGSSASSAAGGLDNEAISLLLGAFSDGLTGTVTAPDPNTKALAGSSLSALAGTLLAVGGDGGGEGDLFAMQRRRHFGRVSTPLVRQPYPRKVR